MRSLHFRYSIAAAAIAVAPLFVQAQERTAPPPPELQQIDEDDQPAVTIRKPDTERNITEKREGGVVKEVKVNTGRSTYYIHPNDTPGNVMPGDTQSPTTRPAEWVVHTFDLGQPKAEKEAQPEPVPATPVPAK